MGNSHWLSNRGVIASAEKGSQVAVVSKPTLPRYFRSKSGTESAETVPLKWMDSYRADIQPS